MPKTPKGSAGCFYSKCTSDELSKLLKAVGAPSSASAKAELVARLRAHPVASAYAVEGRSPTISRSENCDLVGGRDGPTLADIKHECKKKGLKVSGTRYELVLSLLQLSSGTLVIPKGGGPRAPSTKPESPDRIYDRIVTKCAAGGTRDSWSNQKYKDHAGDAFGAAFKILKTESRDKGLLAARDGPALGAAAAAVLRGMKDGWDCLPSPGYGDASWELLCIGNELKEIAAVLGPALPAARRAELRQLCAWTDTEMRKFGMDRFQGVADAFADPAAAAGAGASPAAQPVTPAGGVVAAGVAAC